jgi:L-asparaginase
LAAAGARLAGTLRPGQARIAVLASLLAARGTTGTADSGAGVPGGAAEAARAGEILDRVLRATPQALPVSELYLVDGVGN